MSRLDFLPLREFKARFVLEVQQNVRLTRFLWVIAYLVVVYLIDSISYLVQRESLELGRMQSLLSETVQIEPKTDWEVRLTQEQLALDSYRQLCWQVPNVEIASAELQTVLQNHVADHAINASRLTLAIPESAQTDAGNSWIIRAQLSGRIPDRTLPGLIYDLESLPRYLSIDRVGLVSARGALNMVVAACFLEQRA